MPNRAQWGLLGLVLAMGLSGCEGANPVSPAPSSLPAPAFPASPTPTLIVFTEPGTGFSTTEMRDVHEQVLQLNSANELIWTADDTRLPGYRSQSAWVPGVYFILGKICAEGCDFEVRFGTRNGERRAYLTADYGHDNPGTLVDVEVSGGALTVTRTSQFVPGSFTLSGVVSEVTPTGNVPVEGVTVYRGVVNGYRSAMTDRNGFYSMPGMIDGRDVVGTSKEGYAKTEHMGVSINGDTRFDIQIVRQ